MKKKILALLMVAAMALGITACGGGDSDLIKVGIINNDPSESGYRAANVADFEKMFTKGNGYDAKFFFSLDNDKQLAQAEKYINDGVDYLLLSAAGTSGWEDVLQKAKDAGVKVILFDRTIDADPSLYEASIVSDMAKEGQTAVDWLKGQGLSEYKIIHLQGVTAVTWLANQKLDEYKVIHIQGVIGSSAQIGRSGALNDKVAAESNWSIVKQQTADWSQETAKQIVQAVIDSKEDFNVIYAENDDMAAGAVQALEAAGITYGVGGKVIIMGFDCNKWALQNVKDGKWNYDGQCSPFQAEAVHKIIQDLEKGTAPAQKTIIQDEKGFDASTITQEDVDKYGI